MKKNKKPDYIFKDNLRRFFLKDMLIRKDYLKNLTLEQLDNLVNGVNTLLSNLNFDFERGKAVIPINDKHNWEGNSFFRKIILHNVLEIENKNKNTTYVGEEEMISMLKERWTKNRERILKELE